MTKSSYGFVIVSANTSQLIKCIILKTGISYKRLHTLTFYLHNCIPCRYLCIFMLSTVFLLWRNNIAEETS